MTSQSSICSLCFDNIEEKNLLIINESTQDMLGTLLINIDISLSENGVICRTCHRKLENHYCFKKKCIMTEDMLRPFGAENVKMNLTEIHSQIIQSEVEVEKNICRLCLQHSDDDMTLNEDEKQQFRRLFLEVNLNLTNYVILCLTCYNSLQKYFTFVTSFHSNRKMSMNIKKSDEMNVLLLTGELRMKIEADSSDFLEEKLDVDVAQILDIKSEDNKSPLMDIEESDDHDIKPMLLHEEFDIKPDKDSTKEEFLYADSSNIDTRVEIENGGLEEPNCDRFSSRSLIKENCSNRLEDTVLIIHTNSFKFRVFKCEECNYETKYKAHLKQHMRAHLTSSETTMYKCDKCDHKSKWRYNLKNHFISKHTDLSEVTMYKCNKCNFESKWHQQLKLHVISKHTDPSEIQMSKCQQCSYETKHRKTLKQHMLTHATNFSDITVYKCDKCDYVSKWRENLKNHTISKHMDPSQIQMIECSECNYKTKFKDSLKQHMLTHTTNLSEITKYKCDKCDYKTKWRNSIRYHVLNKHTDISKIQMYKCEECSYETKYKANLTQHMRTHLTSSETTMYKCDKCDHKSKRRDNLKNHFIRKHTDLSEITKVNGVSS